MKSIKFILFVVILISCSQMQKKESKDTVVVKPVQDHKITVLENTRWEFKIAEGCVNAFIFKTDSNYRFYSCEMEDTLYGKYYFSGDTLVLNQAGSLYDDVYPEGSIHRVGKKMYWISISNGMLKTIKMSEWVNNKFEESDFKFDENHIYKKVK